MLKNRLIEHLEKFETLDLKKVLIKLPYVPLDTNHDDSRYPIEKEDLIGYMQYNWPDREINQTLKELGYISMKTKLWNNKPRLWINES